MPICLGTPLLTMAVPWMPLAGLEYFQSSPLWWQIWAGQCGLGPHPRPKHLHVSGLKHKIMQSTFTLMQSHTIGKKLKTTPPPQKITHKFSNTNSLPLFQSSFSPMLLYTGIWFCISLCQLFYILQTRRIPLYWLALFTIFLLVNYGSNIFLTSKLLYISEWFMNHGIKWNYRIVKTN